jgi:hypothetical protein
MKARNERTPLTDREKFIYEELAEVPHEQLEAWYNGEYNNLFPMNHKMSIVLTSLVDVKDTEIENAINWLLT